MITKEEYRHLVKSEIEHLDAQTQMTILHHLETKMKEYASNAAMIEHLGSPLKFIESCQRLTFAKTYTTDKQPQDHDPESNATSHDSEKLFQQETVGLASPNTSGRFFHFLLSAFIVVPLYIVMLAVTLALWAVSLSLIISGIWLLIFNQLPLNLMFWIFERSINGLLGIAFILIGIGCSMLAQRGLTGIFFGVKWYIRSTLKGSAS